MVCRLFGATPPRQSELMLGYCQLNPSEQTSFKVQWEKTMLINQVNAFRPFCSFGLSHEGTKPLPEPMLTNHQWCHMGAISREILKISIIDTSLKITDLRGQTTSHLPWDNELTGVMDNSYPRQLVPRTTGSQPTHPPACWYGQIIYGEPSVGTGQIHCVFRERDVAVLGPMGR